MYRTRLFADPFFSNVFDILNETPKFIDRTIKRTNVIENEKDYQIEIAIPGLIKDDISIKVEDDILTISHERDEDETFCFTNSFKKLYTLPDDVSIKGIVAKVENGVLFVILPKEKKKTSERVIEID